MKNLKLIIPFLTLILISVIPLTPVYADHKDCIVYDYADKLTANEEENVNDSIEKAVEKLDMNISIVITDDLDGKSYMTYADDFYDETFGIDTNGILLLINYDTDYDWISTSGKAINEYNDSDIQDIFDKVSPKIVDGNIEDACISFIDSLSYNWFAGFVISFGIGIVIAAIAGIFIASRYKLHKSISATNYVCENKTHMHESKDDFIRTYVTKTRINTDSGGGGSSTHTSSGGGTHGGGGRGR